MNPRLTIIVPVYNASRYIERCVTSLMRQSLRDGVEFLFVDDGSTDASVALIEQTVKTYPERAGQVRIVRNATNQGVYLTRRRGIEEAKGTYIGWCDSDDRVDSDYYQKLLDATQDGAMDIVVCDYTNIREEGESVCHFDIQHTPQDCIEQNYRINSLPMELYVQLFKRDIIRQAFDMIYPTGVGEDTYSVIFAYVLSKSIAYVHNAGYYYDRRVETSIMNTQGHDMQDWLPHQYNLERIAQTLYALPDGKNRFHRTVNSMKYWRKLGYKQAFATEREFYYTFRECYKDINVISHTPNKLRWLVYLLYNYYPLYRLGKMLKVM